MGDLPERICILSSGDADATESAVTFDVQSSGPSVNRESILPLAARVHKTFAGLNRSSDDAHNVSYLPHMTPDQDAVEHE